MPISLSAAAAWSAASNAPSPDQTCQYHIPVRPLGSIPALFLESLTTSDNQIGLSQSCDWQSAFARFAVAPASASAIPHFVPTMCGPTDHWHVGPWRLSLLSDAVVSPAGTMTQITPSFIGAA